MYSGFKILCASVELPESELEFIDHGDNGLPQSFFLSVFLGYGAWKEKIYIYK